MLNTLCHLDEGEILAQYMNATPGIRTLSVKTCMSLPLIIKMNKLKIHSH